jgi:hypothetical protein
MSWRLYWSVQRLQNIFAQKYINPFGWAGRQRWRSPLTFNRWSTIIWHHVAMADEQPPR